MSMSTYVIGFRPPDEKWKKMKAVYDACVAGGIGMPEEVVEFFNGEEPDATGVKVDLTSTKKGGPVTKFGDEYGQGLQIDLTKLPKDIKILRFINSW